MAAPLSPRIKAKVVTALGETHADKQGVFFTALEGDWVSCTRDLADYKTEEEIRGRHAAAASSPPQQAMVCPSGPRPPPPALRRLLLGVKTTPPSKSDVLKRGPPPRTKALPPSEGGYSLVLIDTRKAGTPYYSGGGFWCVLA